KVAVVQPLFREVLEHYDPNHPDFPNLYSFFRTFWYRLPVESVSAMRLRVLSAGRVGSNGTGSIRIGADHFPAVACGQGVPGGFVDRRAERMDRAVAEDEMGLACVERAGEDHRQEGIVG